MSISIMYGGCQNKCTCVIINTIQFNRENVTSENKGIVQVSVYFGTIMSFQTTCGKKIGEILTRATSQQRKNCVATVSSN